MNFLNLLGNLIPLAEEAQLLIAATGHTNVTVNEIAAIFGTLQGGSANLLAGKPVQVLNFDESVNGQHSRVVLYAVQEGSAADTAIKALL